MPLVRPAESQEKPRARESRYGSAERMPEHVVPSPRDGDGGGESFRTYSYHE